MKFNNIFENEKFRVLLWGSIILLWLYAISSKLVEFEKSRSEMLNQALPAWLTEILVWAIPAVELVALVLVANPRTQIKGTVFSLFLLVTFTGYIILVKLHVFSYVPCSCGGIIGNLSWEAHLAFNLFYIGIASLSLAMERNGTNKKEAQHCKVT